MDNLNKAKKDNFSRKTILVTGAAGFIGSRLIVELLREGHQVIAALRNAPTKKEKLLDFIATEGLIDPSISFVEYDLSRDFKLDSLLADTQTKIHVIYHLAASFNWGISKADAQLTNVKSGLALIEWAATLKQLERFIWIGGYRMVSPPKGSPDDLYRKYGGYEASKLLGHQAFIKACKRLNVPWTAIHPATVIDGFYRYGDMQYIGIAEMIGKLYQGRLMALPGGRDTFLPLCNMQYIVSFLIRTMFYPETIAQEYMLLDPTTPKFHHLIHLAAEYIGVSTPHLQLPKILLEKLPEVLLDSSKEQLAFISNENYQVAETEMMATKMGIADLINTTPYFSHWIDRLVLTRFGHMQVATPSRFSYQSRYWTETYIKQSLGSEKASALFLHGIPFDSACWSPIINRITYDQVAMMDLPGLGRSGSYEIMEDNNQQFIDVASKLLAPNSVVIAHSLGCLFALNLAKKYPDKVARLILISPYFVQARAAKIFQIQAISNLIFRFVPKDIIAKDLHPDGQKNPSVGYAMDSLCRVPVSKHISEYMHLVNLPQQRAAQTTLLNELRSKVEIIIGEKNPIVTPISPDIPVHIIAGAGHNPHITHVEAVYDYLTPVLTKYISTTAQLSDV
ncbi:alpha/beta fold hydrolase [Acinetobacter nosocomialis]|nr:alpha/beta fold hydrolase [Acinetobacter nosocomialis]MDO7216170.1 alpha/beta fold hydrolase [Acinetobacter nosocomialis]